MILGFTGTQSGMNEFQKNKVIELLHKLDPDTIHHGDCIGADSQFHFIFVRFHIVYNTRERKIVIHPPDNMVKRACVGEIITYSEGLRAQLRDCKYKLIIENKEPLPYMVRNFNIVTESEQLIACPKEVQHTLRSGTWSTVRKGWKKKIPVHVIPPLEK